MGYIGDTQVVTSDRPERTDRDVAELKSIGFGLSAFGDSPVRASGRKPGDVWAICSTSSTHRVEWRPGSTS